MADVVEDTKSEIEEIKSLEEFQHEMKELINSLISEETDSLEGLVSLCNHGLNKIFKNCEVIKLRKLFSDTEYILWSIIKINKDFVYTFIFRVFSQNELKSLKTYKKIEEVNLDTLNDFTLRTFDDLFTFIISQERLDYSVVSDKNVENELSSFENFLKRVSFKKNSLTEYSEDLPVKYKKRKQDLYRSNTHNNLTHQHHKSKYQHKNRPKSKYQHKNRPKSKYQHKNRPKSKYVVEKKHNSKKEKNISQLRKKYRTYNPESLQKNKQKSKNRKYKEKGYSKKRENHKHHKKHSSRQKLQEEHITYEDYKNLCQENKSQIIEEIPVKEKIFDEEVYTSSEEPSLYSNEKSRSYSESKSSSA